MLTHETGHTVMQLFELWSCYGGGALIDDEVEAVEVGGCWRARQCHLRQQLLHQC